tara:strand:- start:516 stop:647 length:132 start_codon:yes stop_codon:yes gene_type:complete
LTPPHYNWYFWETKKTGKLYWAQNPEKAFLFLVAKKKRACAII